MRDKIIETILDSKDEFISGEELSKKLGISRAAIWKHMKVLKEEGYNIESVNRKGYRLIGSNDDLLNPQNDYVFKRIFRHQGNESITKNFISAVLNYSFSRLGKIYY